MKLTFYTKIINYSILLILVSLMSSTVLKNMNTIKQHSNCDNSCQVCQRTVYQLKFQQIADCDFNSNCRGTCQKIKENWNTSWSPFQPFLKDQFGKCEICFRAGFCSISECKEQESKEFDVINSVINKATLTAKLDENLLKNLPGITSVNEKDISSTHKLNENLDSKIRKELKNAIKDHDTQGFVPKIQSLIKLYFQEPYEPVRDKVNFIFANNNNNVVGSDITYWNAQTNKNVVQAKKQTDNVIQKLENQLKTIENAKGSKENVKDDINKAIKATEDVLKKVEKKYNKAEKKVVKKEQKIERALNTVADDKSKSLIQDSLRQVHDVKQSLQQTRFEIKRLENQIRGKKN